MTTFIDPSFAARNPGDAQQRLTRAQFRQFQREFEPLQNEAIARIQDLNAANELADNAGTRVAEAFNAQARAGERRATRRGIALSGDERRVAGRTRDLARAVGIADAENTTRRAVRESQGQTAADALNIGRDISGQASQALSSAAGLESARDRTGDRLKAQQRQSVISSTASGVGLGAAAGSAGLLGAGIGAAGGAGIGAGAGLALALI